MKAYTNLILPVKIRNSAYKNKQIVIAGQPSDDDRITIIICPIMNFTVDLVLKISV